MALIASWSFSENAGQTAADASGNGNTATLGIDSSSEPSDPTWVPGQLGSALQFDGSDDRVTVPNSASLQNLTAFTYAFWVYLTSLTGGGSNQRLFSRETSAGLDELYLFQGASSLEANIGNTVNTRFVADMAAPAQLSINTWHHVAVTYDDLGDRLLHLIVNGTETSYGTHTAVTGTLRTTTNTLMLGNRADGLRATQGIIDEFRIFNTALTPQEIRTQLYAPQSGLWASGYQAVGNLGEVASAQPTDSTGSKVRVLETSPVLPSPTPAVGGQGVVTPVETQVFVVSDGT